MIKDYFSKHFKIDKAGEYIHISCTEFKKIEIAYNELELENAKMRLLFKYILDNHHDGLHQVIYDDVYKYSREDR